MKLQVFAIKDRALNSYLQPFFAQSIGAAVRAFSDGINDRNHEMHRHPDDYDLWHLGTFDSDKGTFATEQGNAHMEVIWPQQVAIGKNVIRPDDQYATTAMK